MNISTHLGIISPSVNGTPFKSDLQENKNDIAPRDTGSKVVLSSQQFQSLVQEPNVYSEPKRITRLAFSNPVEVSNSTKQFAQSSLNTHLGVSLSGGALRLSELVDSGKNSYEQDIRQYSNYESYQGRRDSREAINIEDFKDLKYNKNESLTLKLKTKDGDTINFTLQGYTGSGETPDKEGAIFKGVKVSFEFEGKLSQQEKDQLNTFTQNIDQMVKQLSSSKDFDFNQLDLTSLTSFSDIDIAFKPSGSAKEITTELKLNYKDTETERSIDVDFLGHQSQLDIDKTSLGAGASSQQQQKGLQQYLTILEDSAREAHAQDSASSLMKNVFEAGFKGLGLDEAESNNKNAIDASKLSLNSIENESIKDIHNKTLVPLPDFDFSFDSKVENPNKENMPLEYQGFKVDLSMVTQIKEDQNEQKTTAIQTQKFELSGAYYSPLDGLDQPDFENQNYKYTQIDRSSEKVTTIQTEHGQLLSAITTESGESSSKTLEYQMGKLVDEDEDSSSFLEVTDFTELAKQESEQQSHALLKTVMIDPFETTQAANDTNTLSITD